MLSVIVLDMYVLDVYIPLGCKEIFGWGVHSSICLYIHLVTYMYYDIWRKKTLSGFLWYTCSSGVSHDVFNFTPHCLPCIAFKAVGPLVCWPVISCQVLVVRSDKVIYNINCNSLNIQPFGSIVTLLHCDSTEDEDEDVVSLSNRLQHACTCHLKVEGLPSGFCRDVHGQVRFYFPIYFFPSIFLPVLPLFEGLQNNNCKYSRSPLHFVCIWLLTLEEYSKSFRNQNLPVQK